MLKQSFNQIIRSLWRNKSLTFINLLGLSIGIAAVAVLFLIAHYENSFDAYHSERDNLYRVVSEREQPDGIEHEATVPYPTGRFLRQEVPGIEATQIHFAGEMQVQVGNNAPVLQQNVVFADSVFFKVLDFEKVEDFWIMGNPETALDDPGKVLLTENKARELFGDQNPVGEVIRLDNKVDVEVAGVIKDVFKRSHLPVSMLVSFSTLNNELLG